MALSNSKKWLDSSIRQSVFGLLEKSPLLTATNLCKLLGLSYGRHQAYVNRLKHEWRSNHKNEHGSKCSLHAWRGWCYVPDSLDRVRAVKEGWLASKARNRWLLWKDKLGRLQWFETGRVNLYVRRPANSGRACQLVCNGFSFTGLITDIKILEAVLAGVRFKGAHYVFESNRQLPRLVIDLFSRSNGIVIKVGDASHPSGVEVIATYPDWAERNEHLLERLNGILESAFAKPIFKESSDNPGYVS